jgi:uncharacterized protein YjbI with pentapeptide repeats
MKDTWKILEELSAPPAAPPAPTRREKLRSLGLAVSAVLVIVLVVWGSLASIQGASGPVSWKMLLAAGVAGAFALAVLWKMPQWQVGQVEGLAEKERFDRVNEARKTLALIVAGLALLASFYAAVLNRKIAQKSLVLVQQKQETERFSKAIDQMGAVDASGKKNLEVRNGGIYAMERIANESKDNHWPAIEVLAAYVRGNAPRALTAAKTGTASGPSDVKPAADIQTVLTVIGRRNLQSEYSRPVLDLHETDLRGANLSQARLIRADLSAADLSAVRATEVNLIRADLRAADLSWADLNGAQLTGADLSGARLYAAKLGGAFLTDARLAQANLTQAKLDGADLRRADLSGADLNGAELGEADVSGANLQAARNLTQQQIEKAKGSADTKLPEGRRMPEAWKAGAAK